MRTIAEWARRCWFLLNRRRLEASLRAEMRAHREMMAEPRRFGNSAALHEAAVDVWGWRWLDDLGRDLRYAAGALRRSPGSSLVIILSLALSAGATAAIFSVVNGVLLRPLSFAEPERLVQVFGRNWRAERAGSADAVTGPVGGEELQAYRTQSSTFDGFAGYAPFTVHVQGSSGTERLTAVRAESTLFAVLQAEALIGRGFQAGDPPGVAVISERLWRERFGADTGIAGRVITLDGRPATVIGVMPEAFQFPYGTSSSLAGSRPEARTDVWLPLEAGRRGRLAVVARLRPGRTIEAGEAELRVIAARVEQQAPSPEMRVGVRLEPLDAVVTGGVRRSLWLLMAAVGLVLSAACINIANLLLARTITRVRELVTRTALGASRARLVRQSLAESLLLALLGSAAGILVARWMLGVLTTVVSTRMPRVHEVAFDWQAFVFLLLVSVAAALVFGLAPALAASQCDVRSVTHAGGPAAPRRLGRLRDLLVVAEVALAFVLAVAALAVLREMARLERIDPGIDVSGVVSLHITPKVSAGEYARLEDAVRALPGIESAAFTQLVPLQNWGWLAEFNVPGRQTPERWSATLRFVTPEYFRTLRVPIRSGRAFTPADASGAPPVVIVNEALVRRYLRGFDPLGLTLDRGTIVGIAGDVHQAGLDQAPEPEIYYPVAQNVATSSDLGMALLVRMHGGRTAPLEAIKRAVQAVDPALAIFNERTLEQVVRDSLWRLTMYRLLIGAFAVLTLLLATIGLQGVVACHAAARAPEFAVRLALGSPRWRLFRLVVGRAVWLALAGAAAGALAVAAFAAWGPAIPFAGVTGPGLLAIVTAVLALMAVISSAVSGLRVARLDPASSLRHS